MAVAGFNIDEVTSQLGAYNRVHNRNIQKQIFQDIVTENYMQSVPNVIDEYVSHNVTIDQLVQPFQAGFTPKGTATFEPYKNKVRHAKVDFKFEEMDKLYQSYLGFLVDEETDPTKTPFVKYIVDLIKLGIRQDIENTMTFKATWEAPTAGTASTPDKATTGIGRIIEAERTASNLTPIATGAITQANALDKFESFVDGIPSKHQNIPGNIYCSPTVARYYVRDYRNTFGGTNDQLAKNNLKIDSTKKEIIGLSSMEGSQMIFFTPANNMIKMFNKVYVPNMFEFQRQDRVIKVLSDWFRGYGFRTLETVYVNDQNVDPA